MTTQLAPLLDIPVVDLSTGKFTPQFRLWLTQQLIARVGGTVALSNTELAGQVSGVTGATGSLSSRVTTLETEFAALQVQVEAMGEGIAAELAGLRSIADLRSRVEQLEDART